MMSESAALVPPLALPKIDDATSTNTNNAGEEDREPKKWWIRKHQQQIFA